MYEVAVIGDGLAGAILSNKLSEKGVNFCWIGDEGPGSSLVAAGIMNPITGRKFVLSWNYPQLIETAKRFYRSLPFENPFNEYLIYRALPSPGDYNEWIVRSSGEAGKFGKLDIGPSFITSNFNFNVEGWIKIIGGGRLNIAQFLKSSKRHFSEKYFNNRILKEKIKPVQRQLYLSDLPAKKYIFAEGFNSLFPFLNDSIRPAKGESIVFECKDIPQHFLLKHKYFIAPLGNHIFWLGSNYEQSLDLRPSQLNYEKMCAYLSKHLNHSFSIIKHETGIRPTVKDRKPLIGRHPEIENVYFLNGLGSKGSTLGPWSADRLLDFMMQDIPIPWEVDLKRFI
jgi:glycine/D-amino acid oxidase-like deaminating enzyme